MITFINIWALLHEHGASSKKEQGTRRFWDTLTPEEQERAFSNISRKLQTGEFVHYDPIRAIKENLRTTSRDQPRPQWLRGDEKDLDIVQVHIGDAYKLCTRETMDTFNLQYVKDWN